MSDDPENDTLDDMAIIQAVVSLAIPALALIKGGA